MRTCLVVDDSTVARMAARRFLEDLEFSVTEAADFNQGLALCETMTPDLVLVEWEAQGTGVLPFLAALRSLADGTRDEGSGSVLHVADHPPRYHPGPRRRC